MMCFVSHKVLRLVFPVFALLGLAANVAVVFFPSSGGDMKVILLAQLLFLSLALFGLAGGRLGRRFLPSRIAAYLLAGLWPGLGGVVRALFGSQSVLWEKAER